MTETTPTRSQAAEEAENFGSNPSPNPTMGDLIATRFERRELLRGGLAVAAIAATVSPIALARAVRAQPNGTPSFNFKEVAAGSDEKHYVAEGYDADILIRWGDPVLPDAPPFDPQKQTPEAQAKQFGYNNDYVAYIPLDGSRSGLLVVNHEYTNEELMFPQLPGRAKTHSDRVALLRAAVTRHLLISFMKGAFGGGFAIVGLDGQKGVGPTWIMPKRRAKAATSTSLSRALARKKSSRPPG